VKHFPSKVRDVSDPPNRKFACLRASVLTAAASRILRLNHLLPTSLYLTLALKIVIQAGHVIQIAMAENE